jgi:hypothetical protein
MHTQGLGYRIVKIDQVNRARINRTQHGVSISGNTLPSTCKGASDWRNVICRHRRCSTGAEAFPFVLKRFR